MGFFLVFFTLPLLAVATFLSLYLMPNEVLGFIKRHVDRARTAARAYWGKVDALFEDLM